MTEVSLGRADTTPLNIGTGELPKPITPFPQERNSRMKFTASARIATVLAGTLMFGLTGCATVTAPSAIDTNGATPTVSAPPVAANTPTLPTGKTVDADEAAKLNQARGSSRAVQVADGSWVVTNVNDPLPAPVQQVLNQQAASVVPADALARSLSDDQLFSISAKAGSTTGKQVLVVARILAYLSFSAETPTTAYTIAPAVGIQPEGTTADKAIATAQAYINSQPDPSRWAIVTNF